MTQKSTSSTPENYPPKDSQNRYQKSESIQPRDHSRAIKFALYPKDRDRFGEIAKRDGLRLSELAVKIIEEYLRVESEIH